MIQAGPNYEIEPSILAVDTEYSKRGVSGHYWSFLSIELIRETNQPSDFQGAM